MFRDSKFARATSSSRKTTRRLPWKSPALRSKLVRCTTSRRAGGRWQSLGVTYTSLHARPFMLYALQQFASRNFHEELQALFTEAAANRVAGLLLRLSVCVSLVTPEVFALRTFGCHKRRQNETSSRREKEGEGETLKEKEQSAGGSETIVSSIKREGLLSASQTAGQTRQPRLIRAMRPKKYSCYNETGWK